MARKVLILNHIEEQNWEIANSFENMRLKGIEIIFSQSGHDASMKFDLNNKDIKLVIINPDTPWLNDVRYSSHSFLAHVQTPCLHYKGPIAIISNDKMPDFETVRVYNIAEFISNFSPVLV